VGSRGGGGGGGGEGGGEGGGGGGAGGVDFKLADRVPVGLSKAKSIRVNGESFLLPSSTDAVGVSRISGRAWAVRAPTQKINRGCVFIRKMR